MWKPTFMVTLVEWLYEIKERTLRLESGWVTCVRHVSDLKKDDIDRASLCGVNMCV